MPEIADTNLPAKDVIRHLTHELRQPLSALESIAFYLQMTMGNGNGADVSAQVNRLQQMVDSANWVLSDVLYLLQMAPANGEEIALDELTEEILSEGWASEGLAVELEIAEGLPAAWADVEQTRHVLRSVFQFLRRTLEEPCWVHVSGYRTAGAVGLAFRAHAPGIDPESLFLPLQGNQLLTCRRVAENNKGRFVAEMDGGGYLTLGVQLPLATQAEVRIDSTPKD